MHSHCNAKNLMTESSYLPFLFSFMNVILQVFHGGRCNPNYSAYTEQFQPKPQTRLLMSYCTVAWMSFK
ncbi:hypothetical protein BDV41DRAFT_539495 [Aspergillus transmontanensis]|uniref:Uncharacterized protein n=1 Tax=Aspergillus transmontanensis TaxID=1034304 RepID=A0A5N6VUL5_9EURO|nr:hypothetical protein BDV41DRAFT_539495 [Aspergillus transmontanensis]